MKNATAFIRVFENRFWNYKYFIVHIFYFNPRHNTPPDY
nr:MAG TPA: hypothetical protein [Caudoviricetes sp.]